MLSSQDYHHKLAESALAWWRDAGVDYVTDGEPMKWLAPVVAHPVPAKPAERVLIEPATPAVVAKAPLAEWPSDLAALKAAIRDGAGLPGCNYGSRCIAPKGEAGATALVIGDFPEEEEIGAGDYGAGPVGTLLTNILLAAQIIPDLTYQTSLAHSRPASGSLSKDDLPTLAAFARHQIAIVRPKVVVLFGAAACEAMLNQDLMAVRGVSHYLNHDDRKTAVVATFHPRTLLAQPQLKAQAWKDLQMLVRKDYL
jgi:uracil-DNA glycosylase family 4